MNNKRILMIHHEGNAVNNPSIKAMIDYFGERGYYFDIVSKKRKLSQPEMPDVRWLFDGWILRRIKTIAENILCSNAMSRCIIWWQWRNRFKNQYDLIIGVDRQGLIEAYYLSQLMRIPYYFISFEIMFAKETSLRFKRLERDASEKVTAWIVQDEVRAEKLAQENLLDRSKVFYLPLASRGLGKFGHGRLRDELGIPKDKHVMIAMGSIEKWAMIDEILKSLPLWPDNWVLIVHDRYGLTKNKIADFITPERNVSCRLFISESSTKYVDDMGYILNGVSFGLAFYRSFAGHLYWGDNLKYLGRASGKIATFFRYGIPVIANNIGIMADDIKTFGLGHIVDSPADIHEILQKNNIKKSNEYRINCQKYFSEMLDFNLFAKRLATKLKFQVCNNDDYHDNL